MGQLFTDKEAREVREIYELEDSTLRQVAGRYQCSVTAITNALRQAGGRPRSRSESLLLVHGRAREDFAITEGQEIREMYEVDGRTLPWIAKRYSCSRAWIENAVKYAGGCLRTYSEAARMAYKTGRQEPARRFADSEEECIAVIYDVGKKSTRAIAQAYNCSRHCIADTVQRRGRKIRSLLEAASLCNPVGATVNSTGYPQVLLSRLEGEAHDVAAQMVQSGRYIARHRLVMALHLHRPLLPTEIVHHRDGDKSNFDLGNLELLTRRIHTTAWGNPYYQKWQETLSEIRELKAKVEKEVCRD